MLTQYHVMPLILVIGVIFIKIRKSPKYGCTHVHFIDRCSRFIVGCASMPVKNPILINELVFRPALLKYGLWEQLRMDHGLEFCLVIHVRQLLSDFHANHLGRECYRQTPSTQNYVVERIWPEVNSRVSYPLKATLYYLDEDDPVMKYSFSWLMFYVSSDAMQHLLDSWNYHRVPGPNGCTPAENMEQTNRGQGTYENF